ncbi:Hypothetical predicted protein [Mytilus galloprovincialis]|uniref:Uncharacterized protein n=1 Tax=Mytilus galloprovincialis TaxID=29158 RepID=A0A8B6CV20_MYTGA|nr:Hypothetical predicted protein [Mytilus galloprovincialis]
MILVPYDRYHTLLADREKSQTGQESKKKTMTPKLGPPGIPKSGRRSQTFKPKHCFGCRNNHPSQRNHSCLMISELEQLNIYFDDALENVDCEELLELWKRDTKLTDIPLELKNTFINLLQNCEWRENNLPDKDGFYEMTRKIIQLGDRFTN